MTSKNPIVANALARNNSWEKVYSIKGLPVKIVYRGNPYNDLKATVEGGNRDYIEIGRFIASSPISQSDAEKLCGAKWSRIKATANSVNALNAKFKVGDVVTVPSSYSSNVNGGKGIVKKVAMGDVYVEFKGYGVIRVPEAYVSIANSCRSTNAVVANAVKAQVKK